jgi:aryl-alcohol dehydrogenase-like predicted oxidoreductase
MNYRRLGRTGLHVSELGLGCMGFGPKDRWFGGADQAAAARMVHAALAAGVNFFDTADVYNKGTSEEYLGKALAGRRGEAIVATKAFCRMGRGPNDAGASRHHLIEACRASLRRLGTDYIDLFQLHEWDSETPLEETLRALEDLVRWGDVRYVGCSNFMAWQMMRALWVSDKNGWTRFESNQMIYNLAERGIEYELGAACADQGVSVLAFSPLAGGYLTGKYASDGKSGRHAFPASAFPRLDRKRMTAYALVAEKVGAAYRRPAAHVALAWPLSKPWVASVIFGATTVEQVEQNVSAGGWSLAAEASALLDRVHA